MRAWPRTSSRSSAAAHARSADSSSARATCTRLRTSPASGIRSAPSRSTKYEASRRASGSGAATTTNAVPACCSSLYVLSARSRKPPNIVSSAETKVWTSDRKPAPRIFVMTFPAVPTATDTTLRYARPLAFAGAVRMRMKRPSRNEPSRCGASRKSSADRLGGVSTTMRSHASSSRPAAFAASAFVRSWPSFSIAMYSWVPANELERAW